MLFLNLLPETFFSPKIPQFEWGNFLKRNTSTLFKNEGFSLFCRHFEWKYVFHKTTDNRFSFNILCFFKFILLDIRY